MLVAPIGRYSFWHRAVDAIGETASESTQALGRPGACNEPVSKQQSDALAKIPMGAIKNRSCARRDPRRHGPRTPLVMAGYDPPSTACRAGPTKDVGDGSYSS